MLIELLDYLSRVKKQNNKRNASGITKSSESSLPVREKVPQLPPDLPQKLPQQTRYEPIPIPENYKEGLLE